MIYILMSDDEYSIHLIEADEELISCVGNYKDFGNLLVQIKNTWYSNYEVLGYCKEIEWVNKQTALECSKAEYEIRPSVLFNEDNEPTDGLKKCPPAFIRELLKRWKDIHSGLSAHFREHQAWSIREVERWLRKAVMEKL